MCKHKDTNDSASRIGQSGGLASCGVAPCRQKKWGNLVKLFSLISRKTRKRKGGKKKGRKWSRPEKRKGKTPGGKKSLANYGRPGS